MEKDKKYNLEGVTLKKFFQEELETMETAKIKAVQEEKFLKSSFKKENAQRSAHTGRLL